MRAVAVPQSYNRNGFYTSAEVLSNEDWGSEPDSEIAAKENGGSTRRSHSSGLKTQKRSARTSVGDPHLAQASLMSEMSAVPSAPSTTGKRRAARNVSPPLASEEDASSMKRSLTTPALRSPAQRRSKSRGEVAEAAGIESRESRTTKASPVPRHVESRVPKRTPRLSPRGSLNGPGRLQSSKDFEERRQWEREAYAEVRQQGWERRHQARRHMQQPATQEVHSLTSSTSRVAVGPSFSPHSERESASEVSSARRDTYDAQLTPSGREQISDDVSTPVLMGSRDARQALVTPQAESVTTPPVPTGPSTTASPHGSSASAFMSPSCREPYEAECQHALQSASLSGATTPSESYDLPLLRMCAHGKTIAQQQAHDSRIMKLIGRRSVLYASDATMAGLQGFSKRRDRDQRPQRCPLSRTSLPGSPSPSSPPKTGSRQHGTPAASLSSAPTRAEASPETHGSTPSASSSAGNAALGKANRKPSTGSVSANDENLIGISHNANLAYLEAPEICSPSSSTAVVTSPTGGSSGHGSLGVQASTESCSSTAPSHYPLEVEASFLGVPQLALESQRPSTDLDRVVTHGEAVDETVLPAVLPKDGSLDPLPVPGIGASQVDPASSAAEGAQNAVIWPGRSMPGKQAAPSLEAPLQYAALPGGGVALVGYPATASLLPGSSVPREMLEGHMYIQEPATLLQNEVGSIIHPQTWHYVSPAALLPSAQQVPSPQPSGAYGTSPGSERLFDPTSVIDAAKEESPNEVTEEVPMLKSLEKPLDVEGKRQLLGELVECLAARTHKAEQALGAEQRANRAMQVTLEVLQRQNLCLQQQLAMLSQSLQYGNLCLQTAEDGSTTIVGTTAAVAQGSAVPLNSQALPVETAVIR